MISQLDELDWQNRDVAGELGVNQSRVSQIKHVALSKLRARLQERIECPNDFVSIISSRC